MNERIVVVDDDAVLLKNSSTILSKYGYKVTCLKSGKLLLGYVDANDADLILLDIRMPDMDGYETLKALREWEKNSGRSETPVVFMTANNDDISETRGLSLGAMDYIKKPFHAEILRLRISRLLELIALQKDLHGQVLLKTRQLESLSLHVVETLADAIDAKDNYTNGHSRRVAVYSREIAKRHGFTPERQEEIYMIGLLHDVGKIGVPDAVINKPGKLTDEEFAKIKNHPAMGAKILSNITEMPNLINGARWHHERYDGKGYPDGLKGEDIPLEARIIAVADAYDAMTSNRSYRLMRSQDFVRDEIEKGSGFQFDPVFAGIMLEMINEDKDFNMRQQNSALG